MFTRDELPTQWRLASLCEVFGDKNHPVGRSYNPDAHASVIRIKNVPAVVVLEPGLIHEFRFRLNDRLAGRDILADRSPLDSGSRNSLRGRFAVRCCVAEKSAAGHFCGVRSRDCGKPVVPLKGLRASFCLGNVLRSDAVAVNEL